ncbi:Hypothetical predicted protein [Scomber scombrus]|uniref:Uncharacterized protein n=1 Tax=Scomber scombrus TaxID=13677 RepID=A0AAV1NN11_SCOSC
MASAVSDKQALTVTLPFGNEGTCACVLRKAAGAVTLVREDACVYASVLWKAPCLNFLSEPLPDVELLRAAEGGRCLCVYFKPKQLQRIDSDISAYSDSSLMLLLLACFHKGSEDPDCLGQRDCSWGMFCILTSTPPYVVGVNGNPVEVKVETHTTSERPPSTVCKKAGIPTGLHTLPHLFPLTGSHSRHFVSGCESCNWRRPHNADLNTGHFGASQPPVNINPTQAQA